MKLLLDTNIFLEILLSQEKSKEAILLLSNTNKYDFFISDFSLHSIGILLFRRRQHEIFKKFFDDIIIGGIATLITLPFREFDRIIKYAQQFNLDFDDAYQYALSEYYGLTIVSFDSDFDNTIKGRKTPAELLD